MALRLQSCVVRAGLVLVTGSACAISSAARDAEPFRRGDEIAGRDFEYNETSFLHRYTYGFRPQRAREWRLNPQGFRASVGSVRSDEFYVFEELRKRWDLNEHILAELRHKRDEDFDGRYDRTVMGLGWHLGSGWSGVAMGDFVGDKENVDAHLELAWRGASGSRIRFALVAPDARYKAKSEIGEYVDRPVTYFGEALWRTGHGHTFWGWLNVNPQTRLRLFDQGYDAVYDQTGAGAEVSLLLRNWRLSLDAEVGDGVRRRRPLAPAQVAGPAAAQPPPPDERDLSRDYLVCGGRLEYHPNDKLGLWAGLRFFELEELDRRPNDPLAEREVLRDEKTAHAGLLWRPRPGWLLWPGVYMDLIDNQDRFPRNPDRQDDLDDTYVGKIAVPLEIAFGGGAALTLNPTMRLDRSRFGGGNVQLQIPF